MQRDTLACAHRGLSAEQPENTLAAFRAAIEAGAQAIELDVRLSHDGHVIIMHDASLARTTDGTARVGDLDLKEIKTYHTSDGPVPTLDDAFTECAAWDGVWNIEIKAPLATDGVLDLMEKHGLQERLMVTSMDPSALMTVHKRSPKTPRGLIVLGPPDADDMLAADDAGCSWLMVHEEYMDANLVQTCMGAGLRLGAWTVNDVARAKDLVGLGVHMVITDRRDVLDSMQSTTALSP